MGVAVILQHAGIFYIMEISPVKLVKVGIVHGAADFQGAVAPEVEQDEAVPGLHGSDGLSILRYDELMEILVDAAKLIPPGFYGVRRTGELPADTVHMAVKAAPDHVPVCLIAVHGDIHAAAAGGNFAVESVVVQLREYALQLIHIL